MVEHLKTAITWSVRVLAVLMTVVIILGVIDVGIILYERFMSPPRFILTVEDMISTFGAFMAVLIAIEIFVNITLYLKDHCIEVKIVIATALMAIARKVIVIDLKTLDAIYIIAIGVAVLSLSIGYWLIHHVEKESLHDNHIAKSPEASTQFTPIQLFQEAWKLHHKRLGLHL